MNSHRFQLNLLQAFRGVAALIVVIHHICASTKEYFQVVLFNDFFKSGWNGVDFFFVLSGFIITYVHFDDIKKQSNIFKFFFKRLIRIYPIYWLISSIALVSILVTGKLSVQTDFIHIVKSYLLIQHEVGPFLGVAWSLIYEVFFYIAFGICILIGYKFVRYIIPAWFIITLMLNLTHSHMIEHIYFSNFILEFLMGCFTCYVYYSILDKIIRYDKLVLTSGILLFISTWIVSYFVTFALKNSLESRMLYGVASSLIILGAALIDTKKTTSVNKYLLAIGNASYVLYLIHPLFLAGIYKFLYSHHEVLSHSSMAYYLITLAITLLIIVCSMYFHILIEKPILKILSYSTLKARITEVKNN